MAEFADLGNLSKYGKKFSMNKKQPDIVAVILLAFLFLILSNCSKSLSDADKEATRSVRNTESVIRDTQFWKTYHANATSVQETIEMDRVIATATAIYKRTIKPTLDYEATHEKFVSEIKQQQTVNAFLTEVSNQ